MGGNKATLEQYIGDMKNPFFFFSLVGGWNRVHGDGKASTKATFLARTQATTTEPTQYLVKVNQGKYVALGPIILQGQADNKPPLDADVLNALREAVGLDPK